MDLSIIIVHYNVVDYLKKCLLSILNSKGKITQEIFVIDNHSIDFSAEMIRREFSVVKLIENEKNMGFSFAANQGIKKSRGRYILLLNPDTIFPKEGMDKLIEYMDKNPKVGICGPKMVNPQGKLLYSCRSFPSFMTSISSSQSILYRYFPSNPLSNKYLLKDFGHSQIKEVDWVSGSCLLARGEMIEQIGFLDEDYFIYVEDVDFCLRAKQHRWKVVYFPLTTFIHYVGRSTSQDRLRMQLEHHKSMYYFYKKHSKSNVVLELFVFFAILFRLFLISLGFLFYRRSNSPKASRSRI